MNERYGLCPHTKSVDARKSINWLLTGASLLFPHSQQFMVNAHDFHKLVTWKNHTPTTD